MRERAIAAFANNDVHLFRAWLSYLKTFFLTSFLHVVHLCLLLCLFLRLRCLLLCACARVRVRACVWQVPPSAAPRRPHRVLVLGPVGAGKSGVARALATKLGLVYTSAGALIRKEIEAKTKVGPAEGRGHIVAWPRGRSAASISDRSHFESRS